MNKKQYIKPRVIEAIDLKAKYGMMDGGTAASVTEYPTGTRTSKSRNSSLQIFVDQDAANNTGSEGVAIKRDPIFGDDWDMDE